MEQFAVIFSAKSTPVRPRLPRATITAAPFSSTFVRRITRSRAIGGISSRGGRGERRCRAPADEFTRARTFSPFFFIFYFSFRFPRVPPRANSRDITFLFPDNDNTSPARSLRQTMARTTFLLCSPERRSMERSQNVSHRFARAAVPPIRVEPRTKAGRT